MIQKFDFYILAIKYYLQGDSWEEAKIFAKRITGCFK